MRTLGILLVVASSVWADETITALGKKFSVMTAGDWKTSAEILELVVKHEPGKPRRPKQFALLEEGPYSAFTLEVDVKRNGKSLLLVFAHQDDDHFNYAHISVDDPAKQNVHNGVFHVFGGDRVRISPLEKESAISTWRDMMGATNPANAAEGTIRKRFAESIERNCSHGSDAPETAAVECGYYFSASELL